MTEKINAAGSSDFALYEKLYDKFSRNSFGRAKALDFAVRNGIVCLQGKVESTALKQELESTAQLIPGVTGVVNYLKVFKPEKF